MGKTPKKAAPEGDERSSYVRRLKTSSASSKPEFSANLPAARTNQPDTENTNRGRPSLGHKHLKAASANNFKSKLRSPAVKSSNRVLKSLTKPTLTDKEAQKSSIPLKISKHKVGAMQPTAEDTEDQIIESARKDYSKDNESNGKSKDLEAIVCIDVSDEMTESDIASGEQDNGQPEDRISEEIEVLQEEPSKEEDEDVALVRDSSGDDNFNLKDDEDESDTKLSLSPGESPAKAPTTDNIAAVSEETMSDEQTSVDVKKKENGESAHEDNEEIIDTEKCRVDVVESTTSESSETAEPVQPVAVLPEPEQTKLTVENVEGNEMEDASFVSFNASLMLKDVQIRLNDCLKENSQLSDVSNMEPSCKDTSFGKTLRNISGRHSINRMRHVTLRSRVTPNSSLYVNVSSASIPDEESRDYKILRHGTGISDMCTSSNGTLFERKRKLDPETEVEAKKVKTDDENGALDTSVGLFQNLRRPVQVSTPNVKEYKFNFDKTPISNFMSTEEKMSPDQQSGVKKWCSIM